jgi:DNA polymerase III delta prime subunit
MVDELHAPVSAPPARVDYDVFLSYSRRDKTFCEQLHQALLGYEKRVWVDWNDIAPAEDWREEMFRGIRMARNFVFVMSPNSLESKHCQEELRYALTHNKRLIPLLWQDIDSADCHPALSRHQWVFARAEDSFDQALQRLLKAIDLETAHVREHTLLLVKAQEWQTHNLDTDFLLRGSELKVALDWLETGIHKEPTPTDLHRDFVQASLEHEQQRQAREMALRRMTPQQMRNRNAILSKVRNIWIDGVLETSLHDQILIDLGLEDHPEAVASAWNLELETPQQRRLLPPRTKLLSIFDQLGDGRTLLILGEPGAGKTTTLLELARDLLHRAEQGVDHRIPLVLNLSSWAIKRNSIPVWIVEELNVKYQVPKPVGKEWVNRQELVLLLDGLDEVTAEYRDDCVTQLNEFHRDYGPEMVVCSRIQDYQMLAGRLSFQQALYLRALNQAQICHYLDSLETDLTGLRHLLETDEALRELARSPLNLNLMAMAYQGVSQADLPQATTLEERRSQLFNTYIRQMFRRPTRTGGQKPYSDAQTTSWLSWLAQRLMQESQTIFLIEQMQPRWLPTRWEKILFSLGYPLLGGALFTVFWIGFYRIFLSAEIRHNAGVFGLVTGIIFWVILSIEAWRIKPIENLKWSWKLARKNLPKSLAFSVLFVLMFVTFFQALKIDALGLAIAYGLLLGFLFGLGNAFRGMDVKTRLQPNQGIWQSGRNAVTFGLGMGLFSAVAMGLVDILFRGENFDEAFSPISLFMVGTLFGLLAAVIGGGKAVIQHVLLRNMLYQNGTMPWNYARFLRYCCDRIFLQKVGGGYIFIHRLLLEHFAGLRKPSSR